jgi:hypothetical protein
MLFVSTLMAAINEKKKKLPKQQNLLFFVSDRKTKW